MFCYSFSLNTVWADLDFKVDLSLHRLHRETNSLKMFASLQLVSNIQKKIRLHPSPLRSPPAMSSFGETASSHALYFTLAATSYSKV